MSVPVGVLGLATLYVILRDVPYSSMTDELEKMCVYVCERERDKNTEKHTLYFHDDAMQTHVPFIITLTVLCL